MKYSSLMSGVKLVGAQPTTGRVLPRSVDPERRAVAHPVELPGVELDRDLLLGVGEVNADVLPRSFMRNCWRGGGKPTATREPEARASRCRCRPGCSRELVAQHFPDPPHGSARPWHQPLRTPSKRLEVRDLASRSSSKTAPSCFVGSDPDTSISARWRSQSGCPADGTCRRRTASVNGDLALHRASRTARRSTRLRCDRVGRSPSARTGIRWNSGT